MMRPTAEHVFSGIDDTAGHVWSGVVETGCVREWRLDPDTSERIGLYDVSDLDSDGDLFWTCLCGARRPFTDDEGAKVDWL